MTIFSVDQRRMVNFMGDDEIAFLQWLKYFVDTEIFDRRQPGYKSENLEWIPVGEGYILSTRNAAKKREEVMNNLRGFDRDLVRKAMREAEKIPFLDALRILKLPYDEENARGETPEQEIFGGGR